MKYVGRLLACRMSTSGGSEDAFHLTNGSLNVEGQSDVSGGGGGGVRSVADVRQWRVRGCSCLPTCLSPNLRQSNILRLIVDVSSSI